MADDDSPFRPGGPLRNGHPRTPEELERRRRAEILRVRAADALTEAGEAFWAKISADFPEASTGDLPLEADQAMEQALYTWLRWNFPNGDELLDEIARM